MTNGNPKKGAYILPSLFTVANLFFGFSAILLAERGDYLFACLSVFVAAVMDMLDGRIARMTGTESEFGAELDSLVDVVSFGVAPAFIFYHWGFSSAGTDVFLRRLGWAAAFVYVSCGALRLARFNIQKSVVDSRYFVGVPIPIAALFISSLILKFPRGSESVLVSFVAAFLVIFVAILMISKIKYNSFKKAKLKKKRPYSFLIVIIAFFAGLIVAPSSVLLLISIGYLIHPFLRKKQEGKKEIS